MIFRKNSDLFNPDFFAFSSKIFFSLSFKNTLIFIGVDFTDSLVSELIDSYDALKDYQHYTVIITDKKNRDDLIYYNPEFGVTDDLNQALNRLINLIKEKE